MSVCSNDRPEPGGGPAGFTTGQLWYLDEDCKMKIQLKMLAGVAIFATLALAGMIGVFAFSAAQPVQAQAAPGATPSAERSLDISTVAPGGQVMVTITAANTGGNPWYVTETLPEGFTTSDGDAVMEMPNARRFRSLGGPAITYTVTVGESVADGDHTISGTLRARPGDAPAMDHTIADSTVAVASNDGAGTAGTAGTAGSTGRRDRRHDERFSQRQAEGPGRYCPDYGQV